MKRFTADLHIHTFVSPCAAPEMNPEAVVNRAREVGIDMIAVCDHNTAQGVTAVLEAAAGKLAVIPGIEITSLEEVHLLGYFPDPDSALKAGEAVLASMDHESRRLLSAASGFSLSKAVDLIRELGGLSVAAHVNRRSFSVIGQLGFIPEGIRFDALEVSAAGMAAGKSERFRLYGLPLLVSSDSHSLAEIGGGFTTLEARSPCFAELASALRREGGRRCEVA